MNEVLRPEVATCSYSEFNPKMGTPIRTSLGAPRYRLKYELTHSMREITPERHMLKMEYGPFVDAYEGKLDSIGIDGIQEKIEQILHALGGGPAPLVMLCFERIYEPGKWCHRTVFAKWYQRQTGLMVPELGRTHGEPPKKAAAKKTSGGQASLF